MGGLGFFCMGVAALAQTGVVMTRSGELLKGEIRFELGQASIQQGDAPAKKITSSELSWLRFQRLSLPEPTLLEGEQRGIVTTRFPEEGFRGVPVTSVESQILFPLRSPRAGDTNLGPFSIRWEGQLIPVIEGMHRFTLRGSGNATLWIQSQIVCRQVSTHGLRQSSASLYLDAKERYNVVLEWSQPAGEAMMHLDWEVVGLGVESIPANRLTHQADTSPRSDLLHGLLGTYYGGSDFSNPRLQRIDRAIDFNWRKRGPYPESGVAERFSATWTGQLVVPETASYRFSVESEGGVRFFIDGEKLYDRWEDFPDTAISVATFPTSIEAGKPHGVKVDFFNEISRSRLKIEFYQDPKSRPLKLGDCLTPDLPAERSEPFLSHDKEIHALRVVPVGVQLTGGSMLGVLPDSASASLLRFRTNGLLRQLPVDAVARIQFAEIPPELEVKFDPQRAGAWLHNGDFLEGDFQGMDEREVRLGSILFGNRGVERDRVLALVLRSFVPSSKPWGVVLRDGSVLRLDELVLEPGSVSLRATPFNGLKVPMALISELRFLP